MRLRRAVAVAVAAAAVLYDRPHHFCYRAHSPPASHHLLLYAATHFPDSILGILPNFASLPTLHPALAPRSGPTSRPASPTSPTRPHSRWTGDSWPSDKRVRRGPVTLPSARLAQSGRKEGCDDAASFMTDINVSCAKCPLELLGTSPSQSCHTCKLPSPAICVAFAGRSPLPTSGRKPPLQRPLAAPGGGGC